VMDSFNRKIDEAMKIREARGEAKYGLIDPLNDYRCFVDETLEEILDSLNYLQWAMEKGEIPFCKWFLVDKDLRFTIFRLIEEKGKGVGHGEEINRSCDVREGV